MQRRIFLKNLAILAAGNSFAGILLANSSRETQSLPEKIEQMFIAELGKQIHDSGLWREKDIKSLKLETLNISKENLAADLQTIIATEFEEEKFLYIPVVQKGYNVGDYTLSHTEIRCHLFAFFLENT